MDNWDAFFFLKFYLTTIFLFLPIALISETCCLKFLFFISGQGSLSLSSLEWIDEMSIKFSWELTLRVLRQIGHMIRARAYRTSGTADTKVELGRVGLGFQWAVAQQSFFINIITQIHLREGCFVSLSRLSCTWAEI